MKVRSLFVASLASAAMLVGGAGSASANIAWCTSDPPTHVDTVAGTNVTVNISVSVPKAEVNYLNDVITDSYAVRKYGGTLVTVNVYLPLGISTAMVVASIYKYGVSASASGTGGTTVTLYLRVPVR
jgi:hypothetical protein